MDIDLKKAKRQYNAHLNGCKKRLDANGNLVKMKLTFDEWLDIWLSSGKYHLRGCKRGQYCMSRKNDIGHYEIGNVEIITHAENVTFANGGGKSHLCGKTGFAHPMFGITGFAHPMFKGTTVATCLSSGKQIFMDGTKEIEKNGFNRGHVSSCITGRLKQHKGYVFHRRSNAQ